MKRMKRVLALGMAVLMCMGLTACGKDFDAAGSDRRYENSDRERIFRNGR